MSNVIAEEENEEETDYFAICICIKNTLCIWEKSAKTNWVLVKRLNWA